MFSDLKHLKRYEIDDQKWNDRIKGAKDSKVYAYTWYLDAMAHGLWSAYISNDYDLVMPILVKKKFLISYIAQPILCQQLGMFTGENVLVDEQKILANLSTKYFKVDYLLKGNIQGGSNYSLKSNHTIDLSQGYEVIEKKYNRNTRRNIHHAIESCINVEEQIDLHSFIQFLKTYDPTGVIQKEEKNITSLLETTQTMGNGLLLCTKDQNGIHSVAYFIIDDARVYFLLCASDDKGKETRAMYCLIDYVIKKYSNTNRHFDFTGSSIPSIARRNEGFGAEIEMYTHYRFRKW